MNFADAPGPLVGIGLRARGEDRSARREPVEEGTAAHRADLAVGGEAREGEARAEGGLDRSGLEQSMLPRNTVDPHTGEGGIARPLIEKDVRRK